MASNEAAVASNEAAAATNAAAMEANLNAERMRNELQQVRQEMQTAADYQRRLSEKQLELNMTAHWEAHLTREAISQGLDPAKVVRAAREREQEAATSAKDALELAKNRLLGAAALRDSVSIGWVSGRVAALIRIVLAFFLVIGGISSDPLGVLLALVLGSAAGAGWIYRKRADMQENARILGVPLPPPLWGMAGAAATGVVWLSVFAVGSTEDSLTTGLTACILYLPITYAIRAQVKKQNPFVAAADKRVSDAATAMGFAEDDLAFATRHPAVKYGLVTGVGQS
ncbi:hypothetical protein ACFV06_32080 [Streptomyces sp. NPDC059618]|uniref:hypothetical protein n=1 Tax=Streptomyces sp. NPDC059618 TaxID=3346887 RepID=UPI00367E527C